MNIWNIRAQSICMQRMDYHFKIIFSIKDTYRYFFHLLKSAAVSVSMCPHGSCFVAGSFLRLR